MKAAKLPINDLKTHPDGVASPVKGSRKRSREEENDDDNSEDVRPKKAIETHVKHEVHWALDGNLLLQFQNVRFKVHRSRLVSESPFFQAIIDTSRGNSSAEYEYQKDVQAIVSSKEFIDGLDCFFFRERWVGRMEMPSARAFAILLDAMNVSIDYIFSPLDLETVKQLLSTSTALCFTRYESFAVKYVEKLFPKRWQDIPEVLSDKAVEGIYLGADYPRLATVLPAAYYELARRPANGVDTKDLEDLEPLELRKLLHLQKQLSKQWDIIASVLEVDCLELATSKRTRCTSSHGLTLKLFLPAKEAYPFDPILGTRYLRRLDWGVRKYCDPALNEVKKRLDAAANDIWTGIQGWLNEVQEQSKAVETTES